MTILKTTSPSFYYAFTGSTSTFATPHTPKHLRVALWAASRRPPPSPPTVRTHANLALTKLAPGSSLGGGARPRGWLPGARSRPLSARRTSTACPTANGGQSASPPEEVDEQAPRKWRHQEATSSHPAAQVAEFLHVALAFLGLPTLTRPALSIEFPLLLPPECWEYPAGQQFGLVLVTLACHLHMVGGHIPRALPTGMEPTARLFMWSQLTHHTQVCA